MSYQDCLDALYTLLSEHNKSLEGDSIPAKINLDSFISCIKASGGTTLERLASFSHEDILEFLPAVISVPGGSQVKPRVLARAIATLFRNSCKGEQKEEESKKPVSAKKAERMTPRELVEAFDPEDASNSVGQRLLATSRGEPFIVYFSGREVDVDTTHRLLMEVKGGYKGRDDIEVGEEIKKVYKVGELPENYADENPLYRGRPLRPDGTCDQTGRSWEGVDLVIRQFIRVAMDVGQIKVTLDKAHDILDLVMEGDAFSSLRKRYRQAALKFDELEKTGNLPNLKIQLGGSEGTGSFPEGKKIVWAPGAVTFSNVPSYTWNPSRSGWVYCDRNKK